MANILGYTILLLFAAVNICLSFSQPSVLSDQNSFLKNFVNHELVSVLGVMLAITVASASNITIELRKMESQYGVAGSFKGTRLEVEKGAFALIYIFALSFALVLLKDVFKKAWGDTGESLINGFALFFVFWTVMILYSLMTLAFQIGPIDITDLDK